MRPLPRVAAATLAALSLLCVTRALPATEKESGGDKERAEQLIAAGAAALRAGDFLAAVERLREALEENPESGEARLHLGNAYRRLGLREKARTEYEAGLRGTGPHVDLLQNLGVVEAESGRFQSATERFRSAVELAPGRADLQHNLGKAYQELARFDEAARAFEQALRLDPGDQASAASLGQLLTMRGQTGRAIDVLSAALDGRADHAEVCYRLGAALIKEGRTPQAAPYLERAVKSDPGHSGAWLRLAEAWRTTGEEKRSREAFARFQSLYEQERRQESESNRRARAIDRDVPAHYERGLKLAAENRWQEAIREFEAILALQPDDTPTLVNVGRLYAAQGDPQRAREFLEKAIQAEPGRVEPYLDLARVERGAGRFREALARTERALALNPETGEAWLLKGILLAESGEWSASAPALERAARLLVDNPEPDAWLSRVYTRLGRAADAEKARQRARARSGAGP